jgi:hypothetical protein
LMMGMRHRDWAIRGVMISLISLEEIKVKFDIDLSFA